MLVQQFPQEQEQLLQEAVGALDAWSSYLPLWDPANPEHHSFAGSMISGESHLSSTAEGRSGNVLKGTSLYLVTRLLLG